jgi:hypothetical protein
MRRSGTDSARPRSAARPMARSAAVSVAGVLAAAVLLASAAGATTLTLSQSQLVATNDVTSLFGGNGEVLSQTLDGDGVLFEIQGGTIDYGKVALRLRLFGADLSAYSSFGLHVEIVSAPNPVEVNPYVQTGPTGSVFTQDVPGVKTQGDAFDTLVPLDGVQQLGDGYALGFQYFTAGGVVDPPAQTVLIRISPIPGADTLVLAPEPTTLLLTALGVASLGLARRTVL